MNSITLRGVRVHNLTNIDVDIPLHQLTAVTGVSGAGKSSLVFDTLYAEAQRRYLQSFSTYTRQFLERFERPDADEIGDLPPAVAIRRAKMSPRTTVGTLTEISEHLRLWFARAGTILCPGCGLRVIAHRTADVVAKLQALPAATRCTIGFPAIVPDEPDQPAWLSGLLEEGYVRMQVAGTVYRLGEQTMPVLPPRSVAWVLLDRVEIGKTPVERLTESVDAGFRRGDGRVGYLIGAREYLVDQRFVCSGCQRVFPAPEPRLFDLHDPLGACPGCAGSGVTGKTSEVCPSCQGRRWNADALAVQIDGRTIADWQARPLRELTNWAEAPAARAIRKRVQALVDLDLGYLTLQQSATTLSDGAARRIALGTALASDLVHILYLIDEPTTGLHPRDTANVIAALRRLRDRGNTVVVIEHDRDVIAAADHVIDLGPGAGEEGGRVVYSGPPTDPEPLLDPPKSRRKPTGILKLCGATAVEFPLGVLCVVTGGSGGGKNHLIEQTLYPALCVAKKKKASPGVRDTEPLGSVTGAHQISDVVLLDQQSLPRSSRSNPATYLKIFDEIRELFAATIDAKIRNFGPGHFSFNQSGGRCETCEGQGTQTIDMQFLADVTTTCPECHGQRYRKEILDIKVRSRSIAEVLDLTVREAFRFFRAQPAIEKKLKFLIDVGLDYLRLGQAVETLAGGEVQRLKLAGHLASSRKPGCLFLLIEPGTGLHPEDVANLLDCFDRLLSAGHSLIVIENDVDVVASADWVIEMHEGRIVAQGPPREPSRKKTQNAQKDK